MRRLAVHLLLAGALGLTGSLGARAQAPVAAADGEGAPAGQRAVAWQLALEGRPAMDLLEDAGLRALPLDSLETAARRVLAAVQRAGYYYAELDSARLDTLAEVATVTFYGTPGPAVEIGEMVVRGATAFAEHDLLRLMDTRPGRPLDPDRLAADLQAVVARYEAAGYPLASVQVAELGPMPGEADRLRLVLDVDEGQTLTLARVEAVGAERTRAAYLARVAGLKPGLPLRAYDPAGIQQRVEATGLFRRVDAPQLLIQADTTAILRIPVVEEAPGAFDLVLGYLPNPAVGSGGGGLVGNGHLVLRNLFGGGRLLALKLNRLPGQVSSVEVRAADPFVAGLPLRAELRFDGLQQDTTFGQQRYGLEVGYRFARGVDVFGTLSRELTKPGQGGLRIVGGEQQIARSSVLFYGLGVRYQALDRLYNPRRGLVAETNLERGRKERATQRVVDGEAVPETVFLQQERLRVHLRGYLPVLARQTAVLGGEAAVLLSNAYDASDLFRFGGATSLRGYNEEQFLGRAVGRLFAEYRYALDRTSFAFVFTDLGYVERPAIEGGPATTDVLPGYGVGAQVGTDLGLVTFTLASNPDDPTGVRAHLGLSIGL